MLSTLCVQVGFENLLMEVPVKIRNSPLTNVLLSEVDSLVSPAEGTNFLDLGTA